MRWISLGLPRERRERECVWRGLMCTPCHEGGRHFVCAANATNPPALPPLQPVSSNLQLKSAWCLVYFSPATAVSPHGSTHPSQLRLLVVAWREFKLVHGFFICCISLHKFRCFSFKPISLGIKAWKVCLAIDFKLILEQNKQPCWNLDSQTGIGRPSKETGIGSAPASSSLCWIIHVSDDRCQRRIKSVAQLLKQIHALACLAQPSLNLHKLQLQSVAPVKQTQDKKTAWGKGANWRRKCNRS
jgi:hypothetical protein